MIPTEDHITVLREILDAGTAGDEKRLFVAFASAHRLLEGGQRDTDGDRTPSAMETGVGGGDIETAIGHTDDGFVVMRFNRLIQWVRWDPATTINIAEAMITAAQAGSKIWMPRTKKKLVLPGLPEGS
jgi:hypothetical protein